MHHQKRRWLSGESDCRFADGLALGGGQGQWLIGQGLDLPLDRGRVARSGVCAQSSFRQSADVGVGDGAG